MSSLLNVKDKTYIRQLDVGLDVKKPYFKSR